MDNTHQTAAGDSNARCVPRGSQHHYTSSCVAQSPSHQEEQRVAVHMLCKALPFRVCAGFESPVMHAGY